MRRASQEISGSSIRRIDFDKLSELSITPETVREVCGSVLWPFLDVPPPEEGYNNESGRVAQYLRRLREVHGGIVPRLEDEANVRYLCGDAEGIDMLTFTPEEIGSMEEIISEAWHRFTDEEKNFWQENLLPPLWFLKALTLKVVGDYRLKGELTSKDAELFDLLERCKMRWWFKILDALVPDALDEKERKRQTVVFGMAMTCFWSGSSVESLTNPEGDLLMHRPFSEIRDPLSFKESILTPIFSISGDAYQCFLDAVRTTVSNLSYNEPSRNQAVYILDNVFQNILAALFPAITAGGRDSSIPWFTRVTEEDIMVLLAHGGWRLTPQSCREILGIFRELFPCLFELGSLVPSAFLINVLPPCS